MELVESFTANFPTSEPPQASHGANQQYKIFVSTWNVGGVVPRDDTDLEDILGTRSNFYDIYVIGFQEVVPLNARNVLRVGESKRISMKWNSLIGGALNRLSSAGSVASHGMTKVYPVKDGSLINGGDGEGGTGPMFECIITKQMVGILLSVWVRCDLRPHVHHPAVSCVGCGLLGCLGNKGGVSARFILHETSFCFVCCHLASGGKEGDELLRNNNAMEIISRTRFYGDSHGNFPRKILDHDRIILLGDLNYRISLPERKTKTLVESKNWETLLENDQLAMEICNGGIFEGWEEGTITFPPTYKYYPNSDKYYGCIQRKKGEKRRSPAWCDRVIWRGEGLHQEHYGKSDSRLSDHRPVRAIFAAEVEPVETIRSRFDFVADL